MCIKPDLPCGSPITVSEQTTTTRKGHQIVNRLTRSCRGRWKKHRTKYRYDSLGQATNRVKYFADGTLVPAQQFGYLFDDIGNRNQTTAGGVPSAPICARPIIR